MTSHQKLPINQLKKSRKIGIMRWIKLQWFDKDVLKQLNSYLPDKIPSPNES